MADHEHVFTSALGSEFLTFWQWINTQSADDQHIYYQGTKEELGELFERWKTDQQIIKHEVFEDGVKIMESNPSGRVL